MKRYPPMLSHLGNKKYLDRKDHTFELKLDGVRLLLYKNNDKIELINKKGTSRDAQYPEITKIGKSIKPKSCVLDGEVIAYNENGLPDFNLLMKRDSFSGFGMIKSETPVTYVVFDILELNGKNLTEKPLLERKRILHDSITEDESIEITVETQDGKLLWKEVVKRKLEGVIAKKNDSTYKEGQRSWDWIKIKNLNTIDAIIVGYTSYLRGVSSLALAVYKQGKLTYIGKVGTGFNETMLGRLKEEFNKIETSKIPVINPPKEEKINWIRPELVAEVEFLQITKDERLRAPSFKRLRDDKSPKECTFEEQIV